MTTVTELKELYVKLGGKLSDVKDITTDAEMIDFIAKTNLGVELPEVTSDDNGDVLTVVEGAWTKAQPVKEVKKLTVSASATSATTFTKALDEMGLKILGVSISQTEAVKILDATGANLSIDLSYHLTSGGVLGTDVTFTSDKAFTQASFSFDVYYVD